ncbi:uncharacterized protein LY79DRAFT_219629 [Colletotrichum navitas]|uniref:Uncharacterized protein n=1 Tax=Colletotrichum navitas TaxID=681940 RepID=A0AAD8Q0J0_9PEZI|nr:uncharacterized protein LY79DRAFT_219629 [Colletotrichum navitas]KAK1590487.1 hypothetical protein LY79DRAFT_219629 [Colletotrichum navitas]
MVFGWFGGFWKRSLVEDEVMSLVVALWRLIQKTSGRGNESVHLYIQKSLSRQPHIPWPAPKKTEGGGPRPSSSSRRRGQMSDEGGQMEPDREALLGECAVCAETQGSIPLRSGLEWGLRPLCVDDGQSSISGGMGTLERAMHAHGGGGEVEARCSPLLGLSFLFRVLFAALLIRLIASSPDKVQGLRLLCEMG